MNIHSADGFTAAPPALTPGVIAARVERLPITSWHVRARIIVGAATFFDAFDALAIAQALPIIVPLWKLSTPQAGFLISAGYVGQILGSIFFGWLAERRGRLPALASAIAIYALMSIACGLASSYGAMLAFRMLQGFGLGGEVPIAAVYISEISKAKGRGRFVLLYENIFSLGLVISGFIGSIVVPSFGWRFMFFVGALPVLLTPFITQVLPESPRWLASRGRLDDADKAVSIMEAAVERATGQPLPALAEIHSMGVQKPSWRDIIGPGAIGKTVAVWTLWFTGYLVYYGFGTWLPTLYRTVFHLGVPLALRYGGLAQLAVCLGSLTCAFVIDWTGRRKLFVAALLLEGLSLLALWALGLATPLHVAVLTSVSCFFAGAAGLSAYLYTPEVYPTRSRAMATALGSTWLRLASMIGPALIGLLVGHGIGAVFLLFGLTPIVASVVVGALAIETAGRSLEEITE